MEKLNYLLKNSYIIIIIFAIAYIISRLATTNTTNTSTNHEMKTSKDDLGFKDETKILLWNENDEKIKSYFIDKFKQLLQADGTYNSSFINITYSEYNFSFCLGAETNDIFCMATSEETLKSLGLNFPINNTLVCTPKTGMTKYTGFRRITI